MPHLNAQALDEDVDGLAFLRAVLDAPSAPRPAVRPVRRRKRAQPIRRQDAGLALATPTMLAPELAASA